MRDIQQISKEITIVPISSVFKPKKQMKKIQHRLPLPNCQFTKDAIRMIVFQITLKKLLSYHKKFIQIFLHNSNE